MLKGKYETYFITPEFNPNINNVLFRTIHMDVFDRFVNSFQFDYIDNKPVSKKSYILYNLDMLIHILNQVDILELLVVHEKSPETTHSIITRISIGSLNKFFINPNQFNIYKKHYIV